MVQNIPIYSLCHKKNSPLFKLQIFDVINKIPKITNTFIIIYTKFVTEYTYDKGYISHIEKLSD